MFAATGARSVGREALRSPESSPRLSPDPELADFLRSRVQSEFAFTTIDDDIKGSREDVEGSEEEAELVLFAGPSKTAESQKIRLSSPDAGNGEPGLHIKKPRCYYFADELTSDKEEEYKATALTGREVVEMSRIPWPGTALPWKVRTLTPAGMKKVVLVGHPPVLFELQHQAKKRARKGKKSRIALRKKTQAVENKQAEQARLALEKEEAEREKRTRRNREKKVKRKAREKALKEVTAGPDEAAPASPEPET
ncbi:hypothetical protein BU23DRAFT_576822 [Bimuria novae-zelandiae CBS 107.79]|uniref:Uncharacterized protein n=1 Tax=Bimuria novae-zelandiae CBS 107.79 TaxID=1447943 RepID=A0A6A5W155_9PLEO|nr:hypothetical protein BU23DRAFT_576822 [Bimuria novae-zelandiae CBS 107.79]